MGNLIDRKYEPLITIQEYLWQQHPEQLINLQNKFFGSDIKIIKDDKEKKDDRK